MEVNKTMSYHEMTIYAPKGAQPGGEDPASEKWTRYRLGDENPIDLTDDQAAENRDWMIGFKRALIALNSGSAGPGEVEGANIVAPVRGTREEFLKLTDSDFKKIFERVKEPPENIQTSQESIDPAFYDWRIERADGSIAPKPAKGWKIRLADGVTFCKARIPELERDSIRLEYEPQRSKDAKLEKPRSLTIARGEAASLREDKIVEPKGLEWDIRLDEDGDRIYLNGGVSGPGAAGTLGSNLYGAKWSEIETASDAIVYFRDDYGAIFRSPRWYRYNVDGSHKLHPNGAVYLIKNRSDLYALQIFDYFEHNGCPVGNFKLRYRKF